MMKRLQYLTLATLVAFAACDEGADPNPPVSGSVTVSVSAEGENVDGATVTLTGEGISQSQTTAGGTASFSEVDAGQYVVSLEGIPGDFAFGSTTQTASVTGNAPDATVSFTGSIVRTASISGQVTAGGAGVEGVSLTLTGGGDGITETDQTDAGGGYAFTGLRSGDYTVTISGFDEEQFEFPTTEATVNVEPGESEVVNFSGAGGDDATISIESITQAGAPINLQNVAGQIEVTVNLNRGAQEVEEIDVLIEGEVAATQVLTPPGELEAGQVIETLTLNVATDQIEAAENGWKPVIFNGGAFISANAWVAGETQPIPSNEVPVVMNNPDKILLVDEMLTPDTPEPAITIDGDTWMTGGAEFTGLNYLAYSSVMPDDVTWASTCDATGNLVGTPTTGIAVSNTLDCAGAEGAVFPGAIDVDGENDGPDGTDVQHPGNGDYVNRGAEFMLGQEPGDPEIETRHFIVETAADLDELELLLDNAGPTVCIDGEAAGESDGMGNPSGVFADRTVACDDIPTLPDGIDNPFELRIAFQDDFDEWWVNQEYPFAQDLHATDDGVGFGGVDFVADDIEAGDDMSSVVAQIWEDDGDGDTNDCVGAEVVTGDELPDAPTITSDADFGKQLCAAGTDALGNPAVGEQPSNYFGADFMNPEVRLAGSTDEAPDVDEPTGDADFEDALDTNIFNIAGDGDGITWPGTVQATQWGLEAIDDRAGFDQNLLHIDYPDDHYPVVQRFLAVDGNGWSVDAGGGVSCDVFDADEDNDDAGDGDNGLTDPGLPDDWQRSSLSADVICAQAEPRYYQYSGWVIDRAGNSSEMLTHNFLVDATAPAEISSVSAAGIFYTVGEDAEFAIFGEDDLEVIDANVAMDYPTTEPGGDTNVLLSFGAFPIGERWGELYDDENDAIAAISDAVLGEPVVLPGSMVLGRIDWTENGGALPAEATGDPDNLADEFNAAGPGPDGENTDFLATAVTGSLLDAGMNEPTTEASANIISAQWTSAIPAPWLAEDFENPGWMIEEDVDGNLTARHRASTSVIEPVFDAVWLVLDLNDAVGTGDELIVCNVLTAPSQINDTGTLRIYLYDLLEFELEDPDGSGPLPPALEQTTETLDPRCDDPAGLGAEWFAFGVMNGAALGTDPGVIIP